MTAAESNAVTILLAEDDAGHSLLVQECFKRAGVNNLVIRFKDGQETWDFLSGAKAGLEPGKSYLLLLDIRMPRLDGTEVLRRVKADPALKTIPVIILTTTDDPREIRFCYELGCNNYLTKPVEFDKFAELIKRLGLFLMIVKISKLRPE